MNVVYLRIPIHHKCKDQLAGLLQAQHPVLSSGNWRDSAEL